MSTWTLDFKSDSDTLGWRTVVSKPSCDTCKAWAKACHKAGWYGQFRIYDDLGRLYREPSLEKVAAGASGGIGAT